MLGSWAPSVTITQINNLIWKAGSVVRKELCTLQQEAESLKLSKPYPQLYSHIHFLCYPQYNLLHLHITILEHVSCVNQHLLVVVTIPPHIVCILSFDNRKYLSVIFSWL